MLRLCCMPAATLLTCLLSAIVAAVHIAFQKSHLHSGICLLPLSLSSPIVTLHSLLCEINVSLWGAMRSEHRCQTLMLYIFYVNNELADRNEVIPLRQLRQPYSLHCNILYIQPTVIIMAPYLSRQYQSPSTGSLFTSY